MVYKIILKDGEVIGKYSDNKSPAQVAKAMMRTIYKDSGRTEADINFLNTRTQKVYTYRSSIYQLSRPIIKYIMGKPIEIHYTIKTQKI